MHTIMPGLLCEFWASHSGPCVWKGSTVLIEPSLPASSFLPGWCLAQSIITLLVSVRSWFSVFFTWHKVDLRFGEVRGVGDHGSRVVESGREGSQVLVTGPWGRADSGVCLSYLFSSL